MSRTTGKILLAVITLLFVYFTYYLFNSSLNFARVYPFERILFGNMFALEIDTAAKSASGGPGYKFGDRILSIEGETVDPSDISETFIRYREYDELDIELETDGFSLSRNTASINNNYFLFLLLLLLFGAVNFIWGCIIYLLGPDEMRSKLFLFFSIALCLFYYGAVIQFSSCNISIVFILAAIVAGFLNVLTALYYTNQENGKIVIGAIIFAVLAIISIYTLIIVKGSDIYPAIFIVLLIYYAFCSLYTLLKLAYGIAGRNYSFIKWRYAVLIIVLIFGNSVPVINFLISCLSDSGFPVSVTSGFTLFFPLLVGNALLRRNQYDLSGFKMFRARDFKLTLFYLFIAGICSVLIYSLLALSELNYYRILYTFVIIFMLVMMLNSFHFLMRKSNDYSYENKDKYAFSAQKITELCSSSAKIEQKLEDIYSEISELTGAVSVRLALFSSAGDEYYLSLGRLVDILTTGNDLYSMMNINRGVILKYALSRNIVLEARVIDFLEKRNFIFAIPLIENKNIKGALLIGERNNKKFFSEDDIYYFQTVASQILQVIESDRLYKDFILKKQYEEELDKASYVQLRLFPKEALKKDCGLDISFFYRPYLRVIGDYFDFFRIDESRTAIVIGDVSGHGLSTAMVLSAVNSITHAILREDLEFSKTFLEINNFLNKSYRGIELITLFIGIFDRKTRSMEYINAGHGAPLLIRKNEKIIQLEGRSKILGADPDANYRSSMIDLKKNDELILYTDGVMEIYNEKTGSGINEDKFIKIVSYNIDKDIDGKILEIEKNVKYHSRDIKDDITIIGVRVR